MSALDEENQLARNEIRLAVIPAAGLGTRLAPATWALPKELMPVGRYPMIQWALEEVSDAGIGQVAVVVSPSKPLLIDFLSKWKRGRRLNLSLVEQPRAIGLADALLRVRHLSRGAPIALLLPDNIFFPYARGRSALAQVLEGFRAGRGDTTGLVRVRKEYAHTWGHAGLVSLSQRGDRLARIERLHPKRRGTLRLIKGVSAYKTFARTVLLPHFFDYLEDASKRRRGGDEVPALQAIIKHDGLSGVLLRGRGFDAGNPAGYGAAVAYWATRPTEKGPQRCGPV